MSTTTPKLVAITTRASSAPAAQGAAQFAALLGNVKTMTVATPGGGADSLAMVEAAVQANMRNESAEHRQGFVRALIDVMCTPVAAPSAEPSPATRSDGASDRLASVTNAAAWELDALLLMMLERVGPDLITQTPEEYQDALVIRGLCMRMRTLAGVLMSRAADEDDAADYEGKVYGRTLSHSLEVEHA